MASLDELVDAIVSRHPEVSREAILKRLSEERERSGGLISEDVLLRIVAAEFGVKLSSGVVSVPSIPISGLVPGLNDVSIAGRVIAVYPSKTANSKFASVLVADKSGVIRVVLWNDKADLVNFGKVKTEQVVKFSHGYTREGRFGRVELHVGQKSTVEIHENSEGESYPTILELSTKIGAITSILRNRRINLVGRVRRILHDSAFQRENSTSGRVMRFVLADETGEISVVVWNEKVKEIKELLKEGAMLQVVNAKVKQALDGKMEVHADRETYIDLLTFSSRKEFCKIAELKEGMKNVNVQGVVSTKPLIREVRTAKGENVKLAVFELKDETGSVWVSVWRKNVEKTINLKPGEKIVIKKADVKKGFADQLEIATRSTTTIETLP
ncbi:MAG: OB-fold nucleic acid binding domain-containing protein [Candidatus Bathyarchaeia archaeon]|nr:hypothetical protein [Candidatus Bathyarchaeota archaeon]